MKRKRKSSKTVDGSVIEMWYDGACEPVNPGGHGGAGVLIRNGGEKIFELSRYLGDGEMSNNVAEYSGLIAGFEWLISNGYAKATIRVFGDNMMSVMQMKGEWRAKKGIYIPWFHKAKKLFEQFGDMTISWIPREDNFEADELSKKALTDKDVELKIQKKG